MTSIEQLSLDAIQGDEKNKQEIKFAGDEVHVTQNSNRVLSRDEEDDFFKEFLEERGIDTSRYSIDKTGLRISEWDSYAGDTMYAYRYRLIEKPTGSVDIEDLLDMIWVDDLVIDESTPTDRDYKVIVLSDTHIGKALSAGGGTEIIIDRWKNGVTRALGDHMYKEVAVIFGGDLIEGYISQNGKNIIQCDRSLSEQIRVATQLIQWTVLEVLRKSHRVIVSSVPGNHGETTRQQGVLMSDSYDISCVQTVQDAIESYVDLAEDEGLTSFITSRITWVYPELNRGSTLFDLNNTKICSVHGHKFKGGPIKGAQNWWSGHIASDRPEADANILIAGHFHNFQTANFTHNRWILCAPSLETESTWFANANGSSAYPGVLSFVPVDGRPTEISIH